MSRDAKNKRTFKPASRLCVVDGCNNQVGRHGALDMCASHYIKAHMERKKSQPTGICACGCGQETILGNKYKQGHWAKQNRLAISSMRFVGAKADHGDGYITVLPEPLKPHMLEHVYIAEQAVGKKLPKGAQVHHVDGNRSNNAPSNLVVCPDSAYHQLLHKRQRALEESGNADFLKCPHCKQWDSASNMYVSPSGKAEHRSCGNEYRKAYYKRRRAEARG